MVNAIVPLVLGTILSSGFIWVPNILYSGIHDRKVSEE